MSQGLGLFFIGGKVEDAPVFRIPYPEGTNAEAMYDAFISSLKANRSSGIEFLEKAMVAKSWEDLI